MKKRLAVLTVTVVSILGLAGSAFAGIYNRAPGSAGGGAPTAPSHCGKCM